MQKGEYFKVPIKLFYHQYASFMGFSGMLYPNMESFLQSKVGISCKIDIQGLYLESCKNFLLLASIMSLKSRKLVKSNQS